MLEQYAMKGARTVLSDPLVPWPFIYSSPEGLMIYIEGGKAEKLYLFPFIEST